MPLDNDSIESANTNAKEKKKFRGFRSANKRQKDSLNKQSNGQFAQTMNASDANDKAAAEVFNGKAPADKAVILNQAELEKAKTYFNRKKRKPQINAAQKARVLSNDEFESSPAGEKRRQDLFDSIPSEQEQAQVLNHATANDTHVEIFKNIPEANRQFGLLKKMSGQKNAQDRYIFNKLDKEKQVQLINEGVSQNAKKNTRYCSNLVFSLKDPNKIADVLVDLPENCPVPEYAIHKGLKTPAEKASVLNSLGNSDSENGKPLRDKLFSSLKTRAFPSLRQGVSKAQVNILSVDDDKLSIKNKGELIDTFDDRQTYDLFDSKLKGQSQPLFNRLKTEHQANAILKISAHEEGLFTKIGNILRRKESCAEKLFNGMDNAHSQASLLEEIIERPSEKTFGKSPQDTAVQLVNSVENPDLLAGIFDSKNLQDDTAKFLFPKVKDVNKQIGVLNSNNMSSERRSLCFNTLDSELPKQAHILSQLDDKHAITVFQKASSSAQRSKLLSEKRYGKYVVSDEKAQVVFNSVPADVQAETLLEGNLHQTRRANKLITNMANNKKAALFEQLCQRPNYQSENGAVNGEQVALAKFKNRKICKIPDKAEILCCRDGISDETKKTLFIKGLNTQQRAQVLSQPIFQQSKLNQQEAVKLAQGLIEEDPNEAAQLFNSGKFDKAARQQTFNGLEASEQVALLTAQNEGSNRYIINNKNAKDMFKNMPPEKFAAQKEILHAVVEQGGDDPKRAKQLFRALDDAKQQANLMDGLAAEQQVKLLAGLHKKNQYAKICTELGRTENGNQKLNNIIQELAKPEANPKHLTNLFNNRNFNSVMAKEAFQSPGLLSDKNKLAILNASVGFYGKGKQLFKTLPAEKQVEFLNTPGLKNKVKYYHCLSLKQKWEFCKTNQKLDPVMSSLVNHYNSFKEFMNDAKALFSSTSKAEVGMNLKQLLVGPWKRALQIFKRDLKNNKDFAIEAGKSVKNDISQSVSQTVDSIKDHGINAADKIKNEVTHTGDKIKDHAQGVVADVKDRVSTAVDDAKYAAKNVASNTKNVFTTAARDVVDKVKKVVPPPPSFLKMAMAGAEQLERRKRAEKEIAESQQVEAYYTSSPALGR